MIKAIGHVAFDAYKFDETLNFYTHVMGFPQMFELLNDKGELWIVYLKISDTVFLELFPKKGTPSEGNRSFSHLCLEVENIEEVVAKISEKGAVIDVQVQTGKDGNKQAWTRDPEGNRIELMEMAPDSLQRQAIERLRTS
jgi:lactoylglutathione lyase